MHNYVKMNGLMGSPRSRKQHKGTVENKHLRQREKELMILIGSILGIVLCFLNQIFGNLGLVLVLNLAFIVMAPVAVIFCFALWLLSLGP
jgi:hypothetical protein